MVGVVAVVATLATTACGSGGGSTPAAPRYATSVGDLTRSTAEARVRSLEPSWTSQTPLGIGEGETAVRWSVHASTQPVPEERPSIGYTWDTASSALRSYSCDIDGKASPDDPVLASCLTLPVAGLDQDALRSWFTATVATPRSRRDYVDHCAANLEWLLNAPPDGSGTGEVLLSVQVPNTATPDGRACTVAAG